MATEEGSVCVPKKLTDLLVVELRNELEKRNLDKSGVKAVLMERLSKSLKESGINPNDYMFSIPCESQKKNTPKRSSGKLSQKDKEDDSENSENDGQDTNDSECEKNVHSSDDKQSDLKGKRSENAEKHKNTKNEKKTGLEAADIVEDALQLDIDDELNEYRDDEVLDLTDPRKDNFKASEDQQREDKTSDGNEDHDENGSLFSSPLKSESSGAAIVPLTANDSHAMDTSSDRKNTTDDLSLVVHVDDTQSEIDADLDMSTVSSNANNESKKYSSSKKDEENKSFQNDGKSSSQLDQNTNESLKEQANDEKSAANTSSTSTKDNAVKSATKESEKSSSKTKSSKSSTSKTTKSSNTEKKSATSTSMGSRNLWVSGLSPKTRASDLQTLFRKYGKVVSAKIITNTRIPGSRCYGFITMETAEQAEQCIQNLNKHELHGRTITVEKNRQLQETGTLRSKVTTAKKEKTKDKDMDKIKEEKDDSPSKEESDKGEDDKKDDKSKSDSEDEKKDDSDNKKSKERKSRERSRSEERRQSLSPFRKMMNRRPIAIRRPLMRRPINSFLAMRRTFRTMPGGITANPVLLRRIETERAIRRRERERELRETERRRVELLRHQREVERKNQEEKDRLEREREKLRLDRERLEREKTEYLRLEREKARLERERIEREREELRRRQAQLPHRLDDTSRGRTSSGPKRVYEQREIEPYWEDRKRNTNRFDNQQNTSGRAPFGESGTTSRFSDFDARNSHGNTFEGRGDYKRTKLDIPSTTTSRGDYEIRRDSQRHGGHDRDDRRAGGGGQGSFYNRDSSRGGVPASRDRERRTGGREDWKTLHDNRRDRYLEKTVASGVASYGSNPRSFVGGDRSDWSSTDRGSNTTNIGKLTYANNSSLGDSRSRQPGLNASIIGGGSNTLGTLFANNGGMPMGGIMSHAGIGTNTNLNSGERSYMHIRRF